jgi:hypothetical protein
MPAKSKSKTAEPRYIPEEVEDGLEIRSEAGTIMIGRLGKGQKQVPAGSVMLMRFLGEEGIELFEKHIPIEVFWTNLRLLKHSPEYVYWMHAVDYDRAVRAVIKMSDRAA